MMNAPMPPKLLAAVDPKQAALNAWPIFGGEPDAPAATPATTPETPAATPPVVTPQPTPAGGGKPADPVASVDVNQLMAQVQTLTSQITALQTENQGYKSAETEAENAKKTKEQQLEMTIAQKDQVIAQATNLLSAKTLENALLTHKDYQWQDVNDAIFNLKDNEGIQITVDIAKQIGTVEGLDTALKDLAARKPWMLAKGPEGDPATQQNNNPPPAPGRPTGRPPAPASSDADKVKQRTALGNKYSAIRSSPVVAR